MAGQSLDVRRAFTKRRRRSASASRWWWRAAIRGSNAKRKSTLDAPLHNGRQVRAGGVRRSMRAAAGEGTAHTAAAHTSSEGASGPPLPSAAVQS
eukprot:SAG11_NODE_16925_length_533_cov_1.426267_1_plen_94_part_01